MTIIAGFSSSRQGTAPLNLAVQLSLGPSLAFKVIDNFLHILRPAHMGNKDGVRRFDDHHIVHPHACYQPVSRHDQHIMTVM